MRSACGCQLPVFNINHFDYGSRIKSTNFHLAPVEDIKSSLPYPHRHDFYHIVWILGGSGYHIIDSVRYEVMPNAVFFMIPGQIHDFGLSPDTVGYSISFSSEFFSCRAQSRHAETGVPAYDFDRIANALYLNPQQTSEMKKILDGIVDEYEMEGQDYEEVIWSLLHVLLIKAMRVSGKNAAEGNVSRNILLSRRFKLLLEKHYSEIADVATYAAMLNVTERALNDATREALGNTASRLIRDRVMLEAKRLLLHSEISVGEIATQLSFEDPAYFSRCFRKHSGRSPVDFRNSLAKLRI